MKKKLFTSESVGAGHPDKVCDQISDAILDACLEKDPDSRVACECFITKDLVLIGGQITSKAKVDYEKVARDTIREIGYVDESYGMSADTCKVIVVISEQSGDIAQGVDNGGAGDQGIMFGYAIDETKTYMPLATHLAHSFLFRANKLRKNGKFKWARPDMKSQVTIDRLDPDNLKIETILLSIQHAEDYDDTKFKQFIKEEIVEKVLEENQIKDSKYKLLINPTGKFSVGGPSADTGLTGRKIIVDTYGGYARHGGGAFSGKDATKVDRSAAYAARYIAKNIVAAKLARECEVQVAYAIGESKPLSLSLTTFGTSKVSEDKILEKVNQIFDLTPQGIIKKLDLKRPIFHKTAVFGHFGREDIDFTWERLDKVEELKELLK